MRSLLRPPQRRASFDAADPTSGYYNDLTLKALAAGSPGDALTLARKLTADRRLAYPITIAQLGLGAWQLSGDDDEWLTVVRYTADWLVREMDEGGYVTCRFAMPHTFRLNPPWPSAMAQGEAASLLVRAARSLARDDLVTHARRAVEPLLDARSRLVAATEHGPVLQEYPTDPPSHVLNGWIFALWGLYDVAHALDDRRATIAFQAGVDALVARLGCYSLWWSWSRYDLFPHRITHAASPFYHRLHIEQLLALDSLAGRSELVATALKWQGGARNPAAVGIALTRKVTFRALNPRRPVR